MFDTPLFRERCRSLHVFLALNGPTPKNKIEDVDVLHKLQRDKLAYLRMNNVHVVRPKSVTYKFEPAHPTVLELAAENPANEEFLKGYRKNVNL